MLGAVAGDIIASPYERTNAKDSGFEMFAEVRGRHPGCGFSPTMNIWCRSEYFKPFSRDNNDPASRISPIALSVSDLKEAIDLARMSAEFTHSHPDSIKGAEAMTEAVWQAWHGRSKDDIRFAMENCYGIDFSLPESDLKTILSGAQKEDVLINGEPSGEYYYRPTGKTDYSTMNTVTAALRCFMEGNGFEDVVRRAVAMGGDSTTIASMAGAVAHAFYRDIPEEIVKQCGKVMETDLRNTMDSYERSLNRKPAEEPDRKVEQTNELAFHIIKKPDGDRIFVADQDRKELIAALKGRFGNDITIIRPKEMQQAYRELCHQEKDGTYVEQKRPEVRTIYFQDGEFRTAVTMTGDTLPDKESRISARKAFCELVDYVQKVKAELYEKVGYVGDGDIHFANAYYPVIFHDRIEILKGDIFAGSVGIDPNSGLLRVDQGGDFGPMEWFGERTESVFSSSSFDSIKEAIGRFCLDEGVGVSDNDRKLNIEVANDDVARSQDQLLIDSLSQGWIRRRSP